MPAFGFKSQFVPLIERGEKTQPTLSMQMVSADQIRMPPGAAVTPATQTTPKRIAKPPLRLNRKGD
ncbi:MAG TPA: hypothetical protein PLU79_09715 [Burkholderiaceae bacterium]|nr:hypothetical protein [Burkholderiaceae bacterium]